MCAGVADDDVTDKIVSVKVDDEEAMISFIDIPGSEVSRRRHGNAS